MTWAKGKWERIPPILTFESLFLFILPFNGEFIGNRFKNSLHSFGLSYARHSHLHSLHRTSMLFLFVNPVDGGNLVDFYINVVPLAAWVLYKELLDRCNTVDNYATMLLQHCYMCLHCHKAFPAHFPRSSVPCYIE